MKINMPSNLSSAGGPLSNADIESQRAHIRYQIRGSQNKAHIAIVIGGLAVILAPYLLMPSIFGGFQGAGHEIGLISPLLVAFMILLSSCIPGAALMLLSIRFFGHASWWSGALHLLENYDPNDKANAITNQSIHQICVVEPRQSVQEYRAKVLMDRPYFTNGDIVYMQHLYDRDSRHITPHDIHKALGLPPSHMDLQFHNPL
jgi:hypothetical protein